MNADIDFALALIPGLTESGRVRSDASLDLRWEIVDDFDRLQLLNGPKGTNDAYATRVDVEPLELF